MDPKFLTESGWKAISTKFKVKDNGLLRALWAYGKLEEDKLDDRLKAIIQVAALAGTLRRAKEVIPLNEVAKYLANVANDAEFQRREILSAKTVAEEAKKKELLEREESELEEEESTNPNAEADYRKLAKELTAGLQHVLSGGGKPFQWVSGKKDSTRRMPVSGLMVAQLIGAQHKQLITKVTGSKHFATGTCLLEEGKLTFLVDDFDPSKFVTELRRSIQYFTGKKFALRARGTDDNNVAEEDPNEDQDGPADQDDGQEPDSPPRFVPGVVDEPRTGPAKPQKPGKASEPQTPSAAEEQEPKQPEAADAAKAAEAKENATRPFEISASVGRGGKNKPDDVQAVQAALNRQAQAGLEVDGKCGPKTITAITAFQKKLGMRNPDGLVEPDKTTARGLSGEKGVQAEQAATGGGGSAAAGGGKPSGAGGAAAAAAAAGAAAASGSLGTVFGVALGAVTGAVAGAAAAAVKAAQEAEERKKAIEKQIQTILNGLKKAAEGAGGGEGKRIKDELESAYKQAQEHIKKIEAAAKDLAARKTKEAAEALKKLAEAAVPGFKIVEDAVKQGSDWLEDNVPGMINDAKDIAKKVTKEVADRKKQADDAYKDIITKMKNAAADELGDEGKKIKDELEQAYKENQEHIKKVAEAAKELAKRETEAAADALKKAAEKTVPGFQTVENLVQKASDWWNSD